jgi:hypothetical protein
MHTKVADQGFGNVVVVEMVVAQPCGNTTQNLKKYYNTKCGDVKI